MNALNTVPLHIFNIMLIRTHLTKLMYGNDKLLKKGEGERTGIDTWDQEGSIDLNSANRKN